MPPPFAGTRSRLGWAVTGSGHFFEESLDLIGRLPNVDLFVSKAAAEVIRMYKSKTAPGSPRLSRHHGLGGASRPLL